MEQLLESVRSGRPIGNGGIWAPPVDIEETDDAWIIEAELPGAVHDDVHVEVRDSELVISGEVKEKERVLTVRVPKGERNRSREIPVTSGRTA